MPRRGYVWIHQTTKEQELPSEQLAPPKVLEAKSYVAGSKPAPEASAKSASIWIPGTFLATFVAVIGAFWIMRPLSEPDAIATVQPNATTPLAVLPFVNLTGDPAHDWVELGLSDMVADALEPYGQEVVPSHLVFSVLSTDLPRSQPPTRAWVEQVMDRLQANSATFVLVYREEEQFRLEYVLYQRGGPRQSNFLLSNDLHSVIGPLSENLARLLMPSLHLTEGQTREFSSHPEATKDYEPVRRSSEDIKAMTKPILEEVLALIPSQLTQVVNENIVRKALELLDLPRTRPPVHGILPMEDGKFLVISDYNPATRESSVDIFDEKGNFIGEGQLPPIVVNMFGGFFGIPTKFVFQDGYAYGVIPNEDYGFDLVRYRYYLKPKKKI